MPIATLGGHIVAGRRMLPDEVVLANYLGEVDDVSTYQFTTIKPVYCYSGDGSSTDNTGRRKNDSATLFIFDKASKAYDSDGNVREYIDHTLWKALPDKSGFWTLDDGGRDYFRKIGIPDREYRITSFQKLKAGSPRMWHFEVTGR